MFGFNKIATIVSVVVLFFSLSLNISAQTNNTAEIPLMMNIPSVALINFVVSNDQMVTYSFSFTYPDNVEQIITPNTGDNTWINYSSVVNNGSSNYITVHLSSGSLPADVSLNLLIGEDVGAGAGKIGKGVGQIILTTYPQNIINDIGSCFTGSGLNRGHQITYIWENPESYNYSLNYENGKIIAVTYTISSTE